MQSYSLQAGGSAAAVEAAYREYRRAMPSTPKFMHTTGWDLEFRVYSAEIKKRKQYVYMEGSLNQGYLAGVVVIIIFKCKTTTENDLLGSALVPRCFGKLPHRCLCTDVSRCWEHIPETPNLKP